MNGSAQMMPAISSLDIVSSFGIGARRLFDAAMQGRPPARLERLEPWSGHGAERVAIPIDGAVLEETFKDLPLRRFSKEMALLQVAAEGALANAGIGPQAIDPAALGVVVSTRYAGLQDYVELFSKGACEGGRVSPVAGPRTGFNAPAAAVSIELGAAGPNATFTNGPVAGFDALSWAIAEIEAGDVGAMLVCGVDVFSPAAALEAVGWSRPGPVALGPRPFDAHRSGAVMADSAVALLLEDEAGLRARGRRPLALVPSVSTAFSPETDVLEASSRALRDALLAAPGAGDVGGCLAGANGSLHGDATEAFAIDAVLGRRVAVSAVKGTAGESEGAGALVQLAMACMSLSHGALPPSVGLTTMDPALPPLAVTSRPVPLEDGRPLVVHASDPEGSAGAALVLGAGGG